MLLKHSRMHNEPFQIISQKTVVGCPCVVLFIMLYKTVLTVESVDEILKSDQTDETCFFRPFAQYLLVLDLCKIKFGIFR